LEPKAIDLNEAIEHLSDLMRSTMGGSATIDLRLRPGLWSALADPTQVELVILNLALNARDAMKVGGTVVIETDNVTVGVPARPEEPPPGDYVMVSVRDSGSGMTEDVLARCFEPFFTTKPVGTGSGLGLSQVLGFLKQSGGGLRIETGVNKGTKVEVYLPRAGVNITSSERPALNDAAPIHSVRRDVVLVVDDDAGVRDVTASVLRDYGYEVEEADGGEAALALIERLPTVDALVLDFAMPGMNGADVARRIQAKRPLIPIVFVTGYADTTALTGIGEEHVIRKPFADHELGERVRQAISRARYSRQAPVTEVSRAMDPQGRPSV
jgi:CheY-like chemotaxis protein